MASNVAVGLHTSVTNAAASSVTTTAATSTDKSTFVLGAAWDTNAGAVSFTSVSDSFGNTYTQKDVEVSFDFGNKLARVYVCETGTGGASHTFTFTVSGSTLLSLFALEDRKSTRLNSSHRL